MAQKRQMLIRIHLTSDPTSVLFSLPNFFSAEIFLQLPITVFLNLCISHVVTLIEI